MAFGLAESVLFETLSCPAGLRLAPNWQKVMMHMLEAGPYFRPPGRSRSATRRLLVAVVLVAITATIPAEVHHALSRPISLGELLNLILARAFEHVGAEEGAIFLRQADGGYERAASRSTNTESSEYLYSETLLREVGDKGLAALHGEHVHLLTG